MKNGFLIIPIAVLFMAACGSGTRPAQDLTEVTPGLFENEVHEEFFNNLSSLCGKSFLGKQVYRSHHGASWADRFMIMHVTVCEANRVFIPFHIDEDHSRTWMFMAEEGKLVFRHQHLHEDGTPEEGSMYGGFANNDGTALVQYFPADEFTATVIEGGGGNLWTVSMNETMTEFSYRLDRDGEKRFELVFDLTNPVVN